MRMAKCPACSGHNVNGFKDKHLDCWGSKCYDCGYTVIDERFHSRKIARFYWNRNYEKLTGEVLPDEMCGRQKGAFMKKELRIGLDKLEKLGADKESD